jgi:hypothetical protein
MGDECQSDGNSDPDANANTSAYGDTDPQPDTNRDSGGYPHAYSGPNSNSNSNSNPDRHPNSNGNGNANPDANCHANTGDSHPDAAPDSQGDRALTLQNSPRGSPIVGRPFLPPSPTAAKIAALIHKRSPLQLRLEGEPSPKQTSIANVEPACPQAGATTRQSQ